MSASGKASRRWASRSVWDIGMDGRCWLTERRRDQSRQCLRNLMGRAVGRPQDAPILRRPLHGSDDAGPRLPRPIDGRSCRARNIGRAPTTPNFKPPGADCLQRTQRWETSNGGGADPQQQDPQVDGSAGACRSGTPCGQGPTARRPGLRHRNLRLQRPDRGGDDRHGASFPEGQPSLAGGFRPS